MLCYAWNEMGIAEHARRLIAGPDGIGRVEHVMVEMATIVRDLLIDGTTYLGDADVRSPAARPGPIRPSRAAATARASSPTRSGS